MAPLTPPPPSCVEARLIMPSSAGGGGKVRGPLPSCLPPLNPSARGEDKTGGERVSRRHECTAITAPSKAQNNSIRYVYGRVPFFFAAFGRGRWEAEGEGGPALGFGFRRYKTPLTPFSPPCCIVISFSGGERKDKQSGGGREREISPPPLPPAVGMKREREKVDPFLTASTPLSPKRGRFLPPPPYMVAWRG